MIRSAADAATVARIRELMGQEAVMIEDGNPRGLIDIVRKNRVDILIAGGRNMYTALKARIPFLDINQEREFGYAGYTGMVELARQLVLTIESPIWQQVRAAAPWARPTAWAATPGRAWSRVCMACLKPSPSLPPSRVSTS